MALPFRVSAILILGEGEVHPVGIHRGNVGPVVADTATRTILWALMGETPALGFTEELFATLSMVGQPLWLLHATTRGLCSCQSGEDHSLHRPPNSGQRRPDFSFVGEPLGYDAYLSIRRVPNGSPLLMYALAKRVLSLI